MKYIAKINSDNYLFQLSEQEILTIVFGETLRSTNIDFLKNLEKGNIDTVNICSKFTQVMNLRYEYKEEYHTFLGILENLKKQFQPIKDYSLLIKETAEQ